MPTATPNPACDEDEPDTVDVTGWVAALQAGKPDAADRPLRKILAHVHRAVAGQFRRFPRVGRFVDLDDVVQNCMIRLMAAFRTFRPESRRQFYALANSHIRRELLDLIKRYYGPHGDGTHLAGIGVGDWSGVVTAVAADPTAVLDRLAAVHELAARLRPDEREAFGLTYYHGLDQAAIAELCRVNVRTVQRWLEAARQRLRGLLADV